MSRLAAWVKELAKAEIRLDYIDFGGGLGIQYTDEKPADISAYARALTKIVRPLGCRLLLEPGRSLVGPSGVLLIGVLYTKETSGKTLVVVDAAMNDLIRPALYEAKHSITKSFLDARVRHRERLVDVVGPVCETGDFLVRDWLLPTAESRELLIVWTAGAYGFVESSNYNARPRPAEVLVEGGRFRIVRRRETRRDLVRGEL